MDAKPWNGDIDPREFGPDPDADRCWCCHVGPLEDCLPECFCGFCLTSRPMRAEQAIREQAAKKGAA